MTSGEKKIDTQLVAGPSLSHSCRFLAFASTKIIQSGAAHASFLLDFDFRDAWRVQRENSLDAFTVGNAAYRKCFIHTAAFAANHYARKYLDSFLVSLHHPRMDADGVAHFK